jgi:hypothetical protein
MFLVIQGWLWGWWQGALAAAPVGPPAELIGCGPAGAVLLAGCGAPAGTTDLTGCF